MVLYFFLLFRVDLPLRLVVVPALWKSHGVRSPTSSGSHRSTGNSASSLLDVLRSLFFSCIDFLPMILIVLTLFLILLLISWPVYRWIDLVGTTEEHNKEPRRSSMRFLAWSMIFLHPHLLFSCCLVCQSSRWSFGNFASRVPGWNAETFKIFKIITTQRTQTGTGWLWLRVFAFCFFCFLRFSFAE